jgi:hypothetical protein
MILFSSHKIKKPGFFSSEFVFFKKIKILIYKYGFNLFYLLYPFYKIFIKQYTMFSISYVLFLNIIKKKFYKFLMKIMTSYSLSQIKCLKTK